MSKFVETVIARHLPEEQGGYRHERLPGGISSETYKVEPNDPNSSQGVLAFTVIRDPSLWWKVEQEYVLRDLIAGDKEVPLPQLYDAGFDDIDGERTAYIFREFVEGTDLDTVLASRLEPRTREQDITTLAHDLGHRLGVMHRHNGAVFGQLGRPETSHTDWASFVLSELENETRLTCQLQEDTQLGGVRVGAVQALLPDLQELVGSLQSSLSTTTSPNLGHGDAHFKNIIADRGQDQTWKVKSFIDTDGALGGDPEIDIAFIENWLHFFPYKQDFFGKRHEFRSSYVGERQVGEHYDDRRLVYHTFRSLSFLRTVFGFDANSFLSANPRNAEYVSGHFGILQSLAGGNALEDVGIPSLI